MPKDAVNRVASRGAEGKREGLWKSWWQKVVRHGRWGGRRMESATTCRTVCAYVGGWVEVYMSRIWARVSRAWTIYKDG